MKQVICILLLALVGVSSMSLMEKYPINYSPKRSIMTLLTQVEAQMKNQGPLDAIQKMIQEFKTTITEEQVKHDQLHAEQQAECKDETEFRVVEIANADAALKEGQETLDGCKSQKVRAEGDLAITKKQLIENRNFLAVVEDTRRREAYNFETFATQYEMTNRAVAEALVILEEIWSGESSFLQLSKHMNGLLKKTVKLGKGHLMNGVMSALVQLSASEIQADEALLNRIKQMFQSFQEKLQGDFEEAAAAEQAAIATYNDEKARLEENITNLIAQQAGLEAELKELNKCIAVQSSIVTSAKLKRDRNQRLLDDAEALCESVEEEYRTATEARSEEQELLAAISERVEARYGEMAEGAKERGRQDEFEYDAQYDYEEKEFVPSV